MRKILIYLKDYKKESVLAPLFKMLEALFELFVPIVMAKVIDIGIANSDRPYIIKMCMILVALGIIGLTCSITAQYFSAKAACGFAEKLRHSLFKHIQSLSFTEMDTIGTSTLITRMTSDINQLQNGVNMFLRLFMRSPFIVFGAMIMAFTIDFKAALVFVIAIPLISVIVFGIMYVSIPLYKKVQSNLDKVLGITRENLTGARVIRAFHKEDSEIQVFGIMYVSIPLYKKVQSNLDKVLGITRENLTGARVIRAFHKEDSEIQRFEDTNSSLAKLQMFVGRISALMNPLTYIIVNISIVAVVWIGGIQVNNGIITQGEVVALVNYMSQILVELIPLTYIIVNISIVAVVWIGGIQVNNGIITQGEVVALVNYMSQILVELIKLANLIILINKAIACGNRVQGIFEIESSLMEDENPIEVSDTPSDNILEFKHVNLKYKNSSQESLTDIDFSVNKGETIGIIGGTGSGKTSLINLIPRFYDVSSGEILLNGINKNEYSVNSLRSKIGVVTQKTVLFKGTIR